MQHSTRGQVAFVNLLRAMVVAAVVFWLVPAAHAQVSIQTIYDFNPTVEGDGPQPVTVVGGKIYSTTGLDGPGLQGIVYSMNPDGSGFQQLAKVSDTGGSSTIGALVSDGTKLYGSTFGQGGLYSGVPTIYSLNLDGSDVQALHTLPFDPSMTINPQLSALTLVGSTLYGTTSSDGANGRGTVFSMNTDGTGYHTLYSFDSTNMGGSALTLIGSHLYGIGQSGTTFNDIGGTIYSINLDGTGIQTLHTFPGTTASANLTVVGNTIYDTTQTPNNPALAGPDATLFSMSLDGNNFQTLHSFAAGSFQPGYGVTLFDGKLFGGASINQLDDQIFSVNLDGSNFQQVLHFKGFPPSADLGNWINGPLLPIGNALYGTTTFSDSGGGTVFAVTVPEPTTVTMALLAIVGLLVARRATGRR